MRGYLVIHFADRESVSLQVGEPTVRGFYRAIETLECMWSRLPGFVATELITE